MSTQLADIQAALTQLTYTVSGTVASPDRAGVANLTVRIVDKNVGADVELAHATTDARGRYTATFGATVFRQRNKSAPDLQAIVYAGPQRIGESSVHYDAPPGTRLDVLLPANCAALPSEHEALTRAIAPHYSGNLRDLKETAAQRDITYLGNKSGWDARAVAIAALADRLAAASGAPLDTRPHDGKPLDAASTDGKAAERKKADASIPAPFYYALLRAGAPADPALLYRLDSAGVERIWRQAIEQGVIPPSLAAQVPRAVHAFQQQSAARTVDVKATTGVSTIGALLDLTFRDDANAKAIYADLHSRFASDSTRFWEAAEKAFGPTAKRLRLNAQLAALTHDNAPLIGRLHEAAKARPLASTADLVANGFYDAGQWRPLIGEDIPPQITGKTPDDRRNNYAELLAAKVRLSFPTAVVSQMIGDRKLALADPANADAVRGFLDAEQSDFHIGMTPVERYLAQKQLRARTDDRVVREVKRVQRVYQITPSDRAMTALLERRVDSSLAVMRYDERGFAQTFAGPMGGEPVARMTYHKARSVASAVLNIAASYLVSRGQPVLGMNANAPVLGGSKNNGTTGSGTSTQSTAYLQPTLETLFGSMDYCDCDECRTILSPAAYLVDLLHFLDKPAATHNPLEVLFARRPDIQHLPLTCENTNKALPYIDMVVEALEYFVANPQQPLSLSNYQGYDTGPGISSDELLASPQHGTPDAYVKLRSDNAIFPPPLPFHEPLALLRKHFAALGVTLPDAMAALRIDDTVDRAANVDDIAYGWRDILIEQLGLSRKQYELLTKSDKPLQALFGLAPSTTEAAARTALSNVKTLSRRLGITYEELVAILRTRFVNPGASLIPRLERLAVSFDDIRKLKNNQLSSTDFLKLVAPGVDAADYNGNIVTWVTTAYPDIVKLLTISVPASSTGPADFASYVLRYADPARSNEAPAAFDFVRILRFVRLWRTLGWTIDDTDAAIAALYPAAQQPTGAGDTADFTRLDTGFKTLLPRLGFVVKFLSRLNVAPKKGLRQLLACFAPIDTTGTASLYARMFRETSLLAKDAAFADNGYGRVLQATNQYVADHAETLRAAFNLTGDELQLIVDSLWTGPVPLTIDNVSAIFRRGWLARSLRLSVAELLPLLAYTGIDPFAMPDAPTPGMTKLLDLVDALRQAGIKPVQALYTIWNDDLTGAATPHLADALVLARTLRAAFADVEQSFAVVDDPTGEITRSRVALAYGTGTSDFFFSVVDATLPIDTAYAHPNAKLDTGLSTAGANRIAYDDLHMRLSFAGELTDAIRTQLIAAAATSPDFGHQAGHAQTADEAQAQQHFVDAVQALSAASHAQVDPFFSDYPELRSALTAYNAASGSTADRRKALLDAILPDLKRRRKQEQALSALTAAAGTDPSLAPTLLGDANVLQSQVAPASGQPRASALADLLALETPGLTRDVWFADMIGSASPDRTSEVEANLAYAAGTGNALPPNGSNAASAISLRFHGYLGAPQDGTYKFVIDTDAAATVTLALDGATIALTRQGGHWTNAASAPITLTAGALARIELRVEKVASSLTVRWQSAGRPLEIIPPSYLYGDAAMSRARDATLRFLRLATLATVLRLSAGEMAFIGTSAAYKINGTGWFNALPVATTQPTADAGALYVAFMALLDLAHIKVSVAPDDTRFLTLLQNPATLLPDGTTLLTTLTGWDAGDVGTLVGRFGGVAGALERLADVPMLRRVFGAEQVVSATGVPVNALLSATTNAPTKDIAAAFQSALRARYAPEAWRAVLRPVNDEMRALRRNALVAYILQQFSISTDPKLVAVDTPDKLFEYFLMDVQMEPVVQTSRIRHALSSVQLFIERCLMNVERDVAPDLFDPDEWAWMKRYRVWEANRKVFLWPENWLEPELRDDQSAFFKEALTELLQSEVTEDSAATALLGYLGKLEEVAKLHISGMYYDDALDDRGRSRDILHVVAHTPGAHRKYYYRKREGGSWWPWEQVKLEIEGDPVMPVVWNDRLFLFWLRILQQPVVDPSAPVGVSTGDDKTTLADAPVSSVKNDLNQGASKNTRVRLGSVLCWTEYHNGKWQPAKTSDINAPLYLDTLAATGSNALDRSKLTLAMAVDTSGGIGDGDLHIGPKVQSSRHFVLHNTHSNPSAAWDGNVLFEEYFLPPTRDVYIKQGPLTIAYDGSSLPDGRLNVEQHVNKTLITPVDSALPALTVVQPRQSLRDAWQAPFFVQDGRHAFYVTSEWSGISVPLSTDGDGGTPVQGVDEVPPTIVEEPEVVIPDPAGPVMSETPGWGEIDAPEMRRMVTEDIYMRVGISSSKPVEYDQAKVGFSNATYTAATSA